MNNNNTKKTIGYRLSTLFANTRSKQKDLAEFLNVKPNIISYFVNGDRTPNIEQIVKISQFFNVSADYLLGLSGVKTADTNVKAICNYTGLSEETVERFKMYADEKYLRIYLEAFNLLFSDEASDYDLFGQFIMQIVDYLSTLSNIVKYNENDIKNNLDNGYSYLCELEFEEDKKSIELSKMRLIDGVKNMCEVLKDLIIYNKDHEIYSIDKALDNGKELETIDEVLKHNEDLFNKYEHTANSEDRLKAYITLFEHKIQYFKEGIKFLKEHQNNNKGCENNGNDKKN